MVSSFLSQNIFAIGLLLLDLRKKKIIYKISITMNELLKNLGVIVLLIGVIILAVPAINGGLSNTILLTGLGVIILGYIGHIVINKRLG